MALVPSVEAVSWCRKPADLVPGAGGGGRGRWLLGLGSVDLGAPGVLTGVLGVSSRTTVTPE